MVDKPSFYTVFLEEMRILQRSIRDTGVNVAMRNGLTPVQAYVLNVLRVHDGEPTKEVARRLCIAPSNLTPVLHDLVEAGHIRREQDAGDRRSYRLWLTEAGRAKSILIDEDINEAFGGEDERTRELHRRVLDGISAYHELMGLGPLEYGEVCGWDRPSDANAGHNQDQSHKEG